MNFIKSFCSFWWSIMFKFVYNSELLTWIFIHFLWFLSYWTAVMRHVPSVSMDTVARQLVTVRTVPVVTLLMATVCAHQVRNKWHVLHYPPYCFVTSRTYSRSPPQDSQALFWARFSSFFIIKVSYLSRYRSEHLLTYCCVLIRRAKNRWR